MTHDPAAALLPSGLRDVLPPEAAFEAATTERLLAVFGRSGYEQVSPPLVEFEDSLLSGVGAAMTRETFRLMDPVSQRMMAVRSDMTPQIARIASTRLAAAPRPLRVSYAGTVLRVTAGQLRPERQFRQAGAELIGNASPAADAEVIVLAVEALATLGVRDITVDLTMPTLVPAVCSALGLRPDRLERLKAALDRKDAALVAEIADPRARGLLLELIDVAGPAGATLTKLAALDLPPRARAAVDQLAEVVRRVEPLADGPSLTVDAVEHRGFEYHDGTSFSLFAAGIRNELGRGGRYRVGANGRAASGEPATGFTLYMDVVLRAVPRAERPRRLYLPADVALDARRQWQQSGWITIAGLEPAEDAAAEAARLGCDHVLVDGAPVDIRKPD